MFSLNLLNSVTKIYIIKRVRTCGLEWKRPGCYHNASNIHTIDMIFKLTPFHASVIYQIPRIFCIHWISVPFKENSNNFLIIQAKYLRIPVWTNVFIPRHSKSLPVEHPRIHSEYIYIQLELKFNTTFIIKSSATCRSGRNVFSRAYPFCYFCSLLKQSESPKYVSECNATGFVRCESVLWNFHWFILTSLCKVFQDKF